MCSNPEIELPHTLQAEIFLHASHLSFKLLNGSSLKRSGSFPWTLDMSYSTPVALKVNLNCGVPHRPALGQRGANSAFVKRARIGPSFVPVSIANNQSQP